MQDPADPRPLAAYEGRHPPGPDWFARAIAQPPEIVPLRHDGASLELLCWGKTGQPGLLLLHGNRAHARWWSPVAVPLSQHFRVAALSWSGMGGSDWRDRYSLAGFGDEALTAAEAAGLFAAGPPAVVAHSFGGGPALVAAERYGERLAGVIILDTHLSENPDKILIPPMPQHRIYPTLQDALARFRLVPPQFCANHYYVDWIARHSLRELSSKESGAPGWTWRFDPLMWDNLEWYDRWRALGAVRCQLVFLYGGVSIANEPAAHEAVRRQAPASTRFQTIADAGHHIMLDQPIVLRDAIDRIARDMQAR